MNKKVAFATDTGTEVNQHFGRLRGFVIVDVVDGHETSRFAVGRPINADRQNGQGNNHSALLDPVADCDILVAGGMGLPMTEHVARQGIDLVLTSVSEISEALAQLIEGTLDHEANRAHQPRHA